jgi:hypothetical protein
MASIIKTDNIQTTGGANIINQCSTTITLGASGDSVVLGAGATATGFGRSGGVNYCTTAKTSPFTAVNGSGYFVNTTCAAVTVTLPASPSAGAIIALKDYGNTWQTNNVTLCNNGSKINGVCATAKLSTQGQSVTLIYVDATKGWQDINDSTSSVTGEAWITATGGTVTTCGNYKIHTFTADGTFCVSGNASCASYQKVDYLVVAGGGGGGGDHGGGGGAGGFRESKCATTSGCWAASPLASATSLPVSVQAYPVVVGAGGAGGCGQSPLPQGLKGVPGSDSSFSTITSAGGGGGAKEPLAGSPPPSANDGVGLPGGSGGGGSYTGAPVPWAGAGGTGNTPPVSPPQGTNGGNGPLGTPAPSNSSSGGGGATQAGLGANPTGGGGDGGAGATTSISANPTSYAGGGGGAGGALGIAKPGGIGGGGAGSKCANATPGTINTGGGGGGAYPDTYAGGAGGSGIVIIRYRYQ